MSREKRLTEGLFRADDLDPGVAVAPVMDDDGRAFRHSLAVDEPFAGRGPAKERHCDQPEPKVQLALVTGAEAAQGAVETGSGQIRGSENPSHQFLCTSLQVSTVAARVKGLFKHHAEQEAR